jgi:uncharacterized protein (TIGR02145 family)
MNSLGLGYDGLDKYGLSFTKTGLFNREAYVNSDYQYFWIQDTGRKDITVAEITTYEIKSDRFSSVINDIKAPVRCVKE